MSLASMLLQQFINGLSLGGVYVLLAVGFTLSIGVLRLLNICHGHFYMLGAYFTFSLYALAGLNYWFAFLLTIPSVFLIGALIHLVGIRPLHGQGFLPPILSTIALAFLIEGVAFLVWPGEARLINTPYNSIIYSIAGASFSQQRLFTFVGAMALTAVLYLFLRRTMLGKALQATTQDEACAELMGINTEWMRLFALGLSAALAAAAGGLIGPLFSVSPSMALEALFKALIVILLGGLGNILAAIGGGLILGLFEAFFGGLVSAAWTPVAMFVGIIIILSVRPQGIFGSKTTEHF